MGKVVIEVDQAAAAGASSNEMVGVLIAVGPTIGLASLVACAPRLAAAIGYDLETDPERRSFRDLAPARRLWGPAGILALTAPVGWHLTTNVRGGQACDRA